MSDTTLVYNITVNAGDGGNTTTYYAFNFGDYSTETIYITFPAGCAGLVGVRLEFNDTPTYPAGSDQFWFYDDYVLQQDVSSQPTTGQWRAAFQNTDWNPHTLQFDFRLNYVDQPNSSATATLVTA